jgi:hypothetical protein
MARSGQITIPAAGTPVRGDGEPGRFFALSAHPDNAAVVWVGEVDGAVSAASGYPLRAGGPPLVVEVANLNQLYFDANSDGDAVCWIKLN